jgi:hypothetical protein
VRFQVARFKCDVLLPQNVAEVCPRRFHIRFRDVVLGRIEGFEGCGRTRVGFLRDHLAVVVAYTRGDKACWSWLACAAVQRYLKKYRRQSQRIDLSPFFAAASESLFVPPSPSGHARRYSHSIASKMACPRPCPFLSFHSSMPIAVALFFPLPRRLRTPSMLLLLLRSSEQLSLAVGFVAALRLRSVRHG